MQIKSRFDLKMHFEILIQILRKGLMMKLIKLLKINSNSKLITIEVATEIIHSL